MAAVQQRVLNWLYSVLTSEYQDVNRTYNDVAQSLSHYSSLTPKTEVYTYENGVSALLLQISGTIPVLFRGTTYRFPICLWIPHAYPREAPMVYVTPSEGMVVRAGQHVDPQGRVYHPYLVGWAQYWDKSNLLDFLAILRDVFAKEPPVVARQQRNPSLGSPQSTTSPPPLPPLPSAVSRSVSQGSASSTPGPPPPPPKQPDFSADRPSPGSGGSGPPLPPLPPGAMRSPKSPSSVPPYANGPAHLPTRQSSLRYESAPRLPQPSVQSDYRASTYNSVGSPEPYRSQQIGQNTQPSTFGPPQHQYGQSGPPQVQQTYAPPPITYQNQIPQWQSQVPQPIPMQPKPKAPPPPDLIDEPLVLPDPTKYKIPLPAPPIPPNPEKDMLLRQLAESLYAQRQHSRSQAESSLSGLKAQNAAMLTAFQSMQAEMRSLESLSALLTSNTSILHKALHDADAVIENSQHRAPPGVDEILVAPTVVGNQLYDLVSEERSLGDALFILGRAVEKGRISPAVFTKTTRSLAREWYLKKALVKKIGRGMGLATEGTVYSQSGESYYSR